MSLLAQKNKLEAEKMQYLKRGEDKKHDKVVKKLAKIDDKLIPIKNKFTLGR